MTDKKKRDQLIEVLADMSSVVGFLIARAAKEDDEMFSVLTKLFTVLLSKMSSLAIPDMTEEELAEALRTNDMKLEMMSKISDKFFEMKN